MSLQPPTDSKHAMLCGAVIVALHEHLPLLYKDVKVRMVDDDKGTHLAGCEIEVGGNVYVLEIRPASRNS